MLRLFSNIWSHQSIKSDKKYSLKDVLLSEPLEITSFRELVKSIAELSYNNPEHVLFFRGQTEEYYKKTKEGDRIISFYPSIYRSPGKSLTEAETEDRFDHLDRRASQLLSLFKERSIRGHEKLGKFPELVWAILQHYEVCTTPLLDVTHSLRVAASFALNGVNSDGFLYVFGFPHPNGSITYSVENEIINIRLLSICPPDAQRPYFQEGFLVGTFPSRRLRKHPGLDVGVRLIAKFSLVSRHFWDQNFHAIPDGALFPKQDKIKQLCDQLTKISIDDLITVSTQTRRKRR
jgi:hypothetical protein